MFEKHAIFNNRKIVYFYSFQIVPQNMNAIAKTGIQENIVKLIGTIAGRTLATMEEHALTKQQILTVLVLLDLEVRFTNKNLSFMAVTIKDILMFFNL